MRLLSSLVLVALVLALSTLAACGDGSETSADDYRARLDAACERLRDQNTSLPQKLRDEHLTLSDASAFARRYGEEFRTTVEALDPPDELSDAHDRLLDVGEEPPGGGDDVTALREWMLEIADVYHALGADGCERGQRAAAEQIAR